MLSNIVRGWNGVSIYRKILRVVLIGLIVFAGWAASPLFYNRTVDEAFPAPAASAPTAMAAAVAADVIASVPTAGVLADTAASDVMTTVQPAPTPAPTPAPASPIALQRGSFVDGSLPGHHAAGTATVFRLENGQQLVRLEDFEATNGPDLFVTFHTGANPETDRGDYFQIAPLKGNLGDQNYELPADFELSQYKSVVIWCRTFNVVFGYAALQPAAEEAV
jgi:hypothetical protein